MQCSVTCGGKFFGAYPVYHIRTRFGLLLEDLDSLAGNVAFAHCDDGDPATPAPLLVTASVDRLLLRQRLTMAAVMKLRGRTMCDRKLSHLARSCRSFFCFRYTGESSLVIRIDAETQCADALSSLLTADFTFVARDPKSNLAVRVPQLLVQGDTQHSEWETVQDRVALRKMRAAAAARDDRSSSAVTAAALIEQGRLLTELPGPSKSGAMLSAATALENTFVTQPQTRNMSGRVFGGFLMKRAFELAFSTAYMFSGCRFSLLCSLQITCRAADH